MNEAPEAADSAPSGEAPPDATRLRSGRQQEQPFQRSLGPAPGQRKHPPSGAICCICWCSRSGPRSTGAAASSAAEHSGRTAFKCSFHGQNGAEASIHGGARAESKLARPALSRFPPPLNRRYLWVRRSSRAARQELPFFAELLEGLPALAVAGVPG